MAGKQRSRRCARVSTQSGSLRVKTSQSQIWTWQLQEIFAIFFSLKILPSSYATHNLTTTRTSVSSSCLNIGSAVAPHTNTDSFERRKPLSGSSEKPLKGFSRLFEQSEGPISAGSDSYSASRHSDPKSCSAGLVRFIKGLQNERIYQTKSLHTIDFLPDLWAFIMTWKYVPQKTHKMVKKAAKTAITKICFDRTCSYIIFKIQCGLN